VNKQSKESIDVDSFLNEYHNQRNLHPTESFKIDFYGGEPLIYFDKIKQIIESTNDVKYFMPTNGLLLTADILSYLQTHNVDVSLSYDGLWQDDNRPQGKRYTNDLYVKRKDFFRSMDNFTIHCMINPGNYNILDNHKYLTDYGTNPDMTIIEDRNVWTSKSVELLNTGITELFDWYISNPTEPLPNFIRCYLMPVIVYKSKRVVVGDCGVGVNHLSFSDNKLVPCNRFKDEPELIPKIEEYKHLSTCDTCEINKYCRKGCIYENIKHGGVIAELCDVYKHVHLCINDMIDKLNTNKHFIGVIEEMVRNEL